MPSLVHVITFTGTGHTERFGGGGVGGRGPAGCVQAAIRTRANARASKASGPSHGCGATADDITRYDDGLKRTQMSAAMDVILRF
jgi:hypothetical protein